VDPDPDAVEATLKNAKLNRLENRIVVVRGTLDDVSAQSFGLIMANLYGPIVLASLPDMTVLLEPAGILLLSGIQLEYAFEVRRDLARLGIELKKYHVLEEYCTILGRKIHK
jgi:ribosomal protein L11 methyltransferase